ncbi:MAG TPA: hypothetical protein VF167_17295 [Longimicrobiaceae bacterium]
MILYWSVTLLAVAAMVGWSAVTNGYLVLMRFRRRGLVMLERGADGLMHLVTPRALPGVLVRYALLTSACSILALYERAHAYVRARKSVALPAKA